MADVGIKIGVCGECGCAGMRVQPNMSSCPALAPEIVPMFCLPCSDYAFKYGVVLRCPVSSHAHAGARLADLYGWYLVSRMQTHPNLLQSGWVDCHILAHTEMTRNKEVRAWGV